MALLKQQKLKRVSGEPPLILTTTSNASHSYGRERQAALSVHGKGIRRRAGAGLAGNAGLIGGEVVQAVPHVFRIGR